MDERTDRVARVAQFLSSGRYVDPVLEDIYADTSPPWHSIWDSIADNQRLSISATSPKSIPADERVDAQIKGMRGQ